MLWLIWVSCTIWKSRILSMGGKKCHLENTNPFISEFQNNFLFSKLNFSTVFEMWSGPIFTEFSVRKGQNSHLVNAHPQFSKELLSSAQMIWNIFWEHVQCRQPNLTANIYLLERGEKHFWWSVYCSYGQDLFCWYKCLCHWSQHLLLT